MHVTSAKHGKTHVFVLISVVSHWLKKWHEFFYPITECSKAKPKQLPIEITFDTQLKTTLTL